MKITKHFNKFTQMYTICLREHKLGEMSVIRASDFEGTWLPVTINWAGCGSQTVEQTKRFEEALTVARGLAMLLETGCVPKDNFNLTIS